MSIGRRFLDMARAELNSLLDYASKRGDGGDADDDRYGESLFGRTPREFEEELERRRRARQEVEDAIHGRRTPEDPPKEPPREPPGTGPGAGGRRPAASGRESEASRVGRAYAALEVPAGADFATVRKAYRTLMRKYHPDHHTESPEKQRAANEIAQRLTEAYQILEKRLRP